jgi:VWFA-related protein
MFARLSIVGVVCLGATVLAAQSRSPQGEPQRPTFTGRIESVRVDLYVLSGAQPVDDLRLDEIAVLEDGVPQAIQTFERIAFAARDAAVPTAPARTLEVSRRIAADARTRLFVVFLEARDVGFALGPRVQTRFPLVEVLNGLVGPDDLVAVMTPYMEVEDLTFTRGLPKIDDRWFPDPSVDPKHLLWDACFPPRTDGTNENMKYRDAERRIFDGLEALVAYLGALREERSHVLVVSDGWLQYTEDTSLQARRPPRLPGPLIGGRGRQDAGVISSQGDVTMTERVWQECEADLQALAGLDHRNRIRELAEHANRSNVSFHPISPAGPDPSTRTGSAGRGGGPFVNSTPLLRQGALRDLGDSTGGVSIVNTNDFERHLARIVTSTSAYYLLGYTPANRDLDGRYRRITVRVSRPGVEVHARPGYLAVPPPKEVSVTVPPVSPVDEALGRLDVAVRAEGRLVPDDGAAFFRAGSAARAPFMATTDPRFRRVERLRLEVPARDTIPAAARLLDRRGEPRSVPVTVTERHDEATGSRWTVLDVTLAPLAIGDYLIEVRHGKTTQYAAFRIVQ